MSTATSLSVRALLNSAIAQSRPLGPARVGHHGLTPPAKALAVAAAAHAHARRGRCCSSCRPIPTSRAPPATSGSFSARSRHCPTPPPIAPCCRCRRIRSIPIAVWRRTSASPRRAPARCMRRRSDRARVIVASAQALLPRLAAPESVLATSFDLRPGVEIEPQALAEILVDGGYERQDPVDEHGEFSVSRRHSRRLSRGRGSVRSASSSSATRSNRSADSIPARSDRSRRWTSFRSSRCVSRMPASETACRNPDPSPRSSITCAPRGRCASSRRAGRRPRADREVERAGSQASFEERIADKVDPEVERRATRGAAVLGLDAESRRVAGRSGGSKSWRSTAN